MGTPLTLGQASEQRELLAVLALAAKRGERGMTLHHGSR